MTGAGIPAEAVEAAARVTQEVCETFDPGGWTEEENWAIWARQIIEAAAPHLLARQLSPTRWWRAIASDGSLLAETSSTDDFTHLDLIDNPGVTFQRLYEETPESEWREEAP